MGMVCRGLTHCSECFSPLADNEYGICKSCEEEFERRKKELEKRKGKDEIKIYCENLCSVQVKGTWIDNEFHMTAKECEEIGFALLSMRTPP